jgi:hypothetical protein
MTPVVKELPMSHSPRLSLKVPARCSVLAVLLALSASACRSGNDNAPPAPAGDPGPDPSPGGNEPETFTVGGSVSGMSGTALEISNNGSDRLQIDVDGAFAFAVELSDGAAYDVQVTVQPQNPDNLCTVEYGSGAIAGADVSDIEILCTGPLELADSMPGDGDTNVSRAVTPVLRFSAELDGSTATAGTISFASDSGNVDFAIDATDGELILSPARKLLPLTEFSVEVSTDLRGAAGERLDDAIEIAFETGDGAWGADIAIDAPGGPENGAQVVYDGDGNALAVWHQEVSGSTNLWANYFAAASGWGTAELVEHNDVDFYAGSPRAVFDGDGNALVVWTQSEGNSGGNVWSSRFVPGSGWATPALIESDAGEVVGAVELAGAADGSALAVWSQYDGQTLNIIANRYDPTAGWATPEIIDALPERGDYPRVAMDASGNALAAWEQADASLQTNIRASRYTPASGWEAPVLVSTDNTRHARGPRIAQDADGNALLLFSQTSGIDAHMHAARFTPSGGWETPVRIGPEVSGTVEYGDVAFAPDGSALAVWEQPIGGGGTVVTTAYANRYTPGSGWEIPAPVSTGDAFYPKVGYDAGGHALAVWYEIEVTRAPNDAFSVWGNRFIAGQGWSSPARISDYGSLIGTYMPSLAVSPNGDAMAVWTRSGEVRVNAFE